MTRIVLLFVLFSLNCHSHADLIADTYKKSENPDLCNSTLRSDPRSAKADAKGLARIMLEAALTKASTTFNQVKKLLSKTTEPVLKGCLTVCTDKYESIVEEIPKAIQNVGSDNSEVSIKEI
ncbi:hypothetical protein ACSBR2_029045 [Camellia fascicularis]